MKAPTVRMARIILFTRPMEAMSAFYRDIIGLKQIGEEKGWREFAAGSARIALHQGAPSPGGKGPKIVFYAKDVAALRAWLVARGARFGKIQKGDIVTLCDGRDPDGNPLQLSSRH